MPRTKRKVKTRSKTHRAEAKKVRTKKNKVNKFAKRSASRRKKKRAVKGKKK